MKHYDNLHSFYNGDDWTNCKEQVLFSRMKDGKVYCEHCGEEITKDFNPNKRNNKNAIVYHHKKELTLFNVNDASISINPDNIAIVHWQCHNEIHKRFCTGQGSTLPTKKVYLITGSSCSGKSTFVKERATDNDIVIDIDDVWQYVTRGARYYKPAWAKPFVFALYKTLIDNVKYTRPFGTWHNAFIIESQPSAKDRNERANELMAEVITMDATEEECLQRLYAEPNGRDIKQYEKFIKDYYKWFC